jgi:hypothetical protein
MASTAILSLEARMAIPSQCEEIEALLQELKDKKEDLQSQLPELAGPQKWKALADIAELNGKIQATTDRLNDCIRAFGPGYRVDVNILDLVPGGSVTLPVTGHIWFLSPPSGQSLAESVSAQNDTCAFVRPPISPSGSIGFSVDEQGSLSFDGELFRSGVLTALPTASTGFPAPTIEVVTPPPFRIPAAKVTPPASIPGLPTGVTLSGPPALVLSSGAMTLTAIGTFATTLAIFGSSFPVTILFAYTLTFNLVPSGDINTLARLCAVRPTGPAGLVATAGGVAGTILFNLAASSLEPSITSMVVPLVETAINSLILTEVSAAVPPGAIVSMRRIVITPTGVSLFLAVSRFLP